MYSNLIKPSGFGLIHPSDPTTHGSAKFLTHREISRSALAQPNGGPCVGFAPAPARGNRDTLLYSPLPGHLATIAPTKAGKTSAQLLTNLLSMTASTVVLDFKRENYDISHAYRRTFSKVQCVDPYSSASDTWNPLEGIRVARSDADDQADEQEDVLYLVDLLVVEGATKDPYWDSAAKMVLAMLILHVCTAPLTDVRNGPGVTERTMAEVVRLLTLPPDLFTQALDDMNKSEHRLVRQHAGILRQTQQSADQFTGVMTGAHEHVKVWGYDRVARVTRHSTVNFRRVRQEPTTLYLCIPLDDKERYRPVLRAMIGWAIRELRWSFVDCQNPVFLFLDEFPQLAHMQAIEDMMAYGAGYGLYLWLFIQDLSQIQRHYAQSWQTLIANATTRSFYGIRDLETAKLVSEMIGQTTVATRTISETHGETLAIGKSTTQTAGGSVTETYEPRRFWWDKLLNRGYSTQQSRSTGQSTTQGMSSGHTSTLGWVGRRLITPEELLSLDPLEQLVFIAGHKPIRAALLPYFRNKILAERAGRWRG